MKLKYLGIGCFVCGVFLWGCSSENQSKKPDLQVAGNTCLSVEQMREDLDYTVKILLDVHPATYEGFSKKQQVIIQQAYEKIQVPMKAGEFYFVVNAVICSLEDGHTSLRPMRNPHNKCVDAGLAWLNDGLFVFTDTELFKPGDKIISIGGKSTDDIFSELSKVIPAENDYWRKHRAARLVRHEEYLHYLNVIHHNEVEFKLQRATEILSIKTPLKAVSECKTDSRRYWVGYEINQGSSLGIFYLDECNDNDEYKSKVREFFAEVSKREIKNIAIDVRQNKGGKSHVIDLFLSYVDIDTYQGFGGDIRCSNILNERYLCSTSSGMEHYNSSIQKNNKQEDDKMIFKGKLFVLTSPKTFSSGNWFAVIIKDNNLGTVIGEPTGNAPTSYGDVPDFQMPHSGFWFNVSYKKWYRPNPANDPADALYPDVLVWTSIEDIVNHRDPQLEALKRIIGNDVAR